MAGRLHTMARALVNDGHAASRLGAGLCDASCMDGASLSSEVPADQIPESSLSVWKASVHDWSRRKPKYPPNPQHVQTQSETNGARTVRCHKVRIPCNAGLQLMGVSWGCIVHVGITTRSNRLTTEPRLSWISRRPAQGVFVHIRLLHGS